MIKRAIKSPIRRGIRKAIGYTPLHTNTYLFPAGTWDTSRTWNTSKKWGQS